MSWVDVVIGLAALSDLRISKGGAVMAAPLPPVADALARWLDAQDAGRDGWDKLRLHASDLGATLPTEGCLRQVWLRLRGAEGAEDGPGRRLMFQHAHRIHEMMVEVLDHLGPGWTVEKVEAPVDGIFGQDGADGRLDVLLVHESGYRLVFDTKTMRGAAFRWLKEVEGIGFPWVEPKPGHRLQVAAYALAEEADGGLLVYVDREGQNWMRFALVKRCDDEVRAAAAELERVSKLGEPPPVLDAAVKRGRPTLPWQCDYCEYLGRSCPGATLNGGA